MADVTSCMGYDVTKRTIPGKNRLRLLCNPQRYICILNMYPSGSQP